MPGIEFEGKTTEEAIEKACNQLHLAKDELKFDIITTGSSGIFGLGGKKARIRVKIEERLSIRQSEEIAETAPEAAPQIRPEPRPETRDELPTAPMVETRPRPAPAERPRGDQGRSQSRRPPRPRREEGRNPETGPEEPRRAEGPRSGKRRPESRRDEPKRDEPRLNQPRAERPQWDKARAERKPRPGPEVPEVFEEDDEGSVLAGPLAPTVLGPGESFHEGPQDEAMTRGLEKLQGILGLMGLTAEVRVARIGERVILSVDGQDSGLLIGKKGATLDALQFLMNKIVNREHEEKHRVIVDTENYRQRRHQSLIELALRMAEKARRGRRPVTISQLSAHDRRVIHLALADQTGLRTRSRGDGPLKNVVIIPVGRREPSRGEVPGDQEPGPRENGVEPSGPTASPVESSSQAGGDLPGPEV